MRTLFAILLLLAVIGFAFWLRFEHAVETPEGREEIVFWHFWGGEDREVVENVVAKFNESQDEFFVRAVAMPGNNLQAKLFLAVAGGDPPDLVNQDDPVIADWATRGVIQPVSSFVPADQVHSVEQSMVPAARRLSLHDGKMFGICNGLDIRALYYNQTMLQRYGLEPPETISDLDKIATTIASPGGRNYQKMGYLPDSRRLSAWAIVFGGQLYDEDTGSLTFARDENIAATKWMSSYQDWYGGDQIAAFRTSIQSLPGAGFPLLPRGDKDLEGRYAVLMDGQWRVRDIQKFQQRRESLGFAVPEFGVCPLPPPTAQTGKKNAGWVNGNFFVIPSGAKNAAGAWEFAKFWIGFTDPSVAAETCSKGGWIPVSTSVIQEETFQDYIDRHPMFRQFVELAESPDQVPLPPVVGASRIKRQLESIGYQALHDNDFSPTASLQAMQHQYSVEAKPHSIAD